MDEETKPTGTTTNFTVPIAIVVAGALIAGALFLNGRGQQAAVLPGTQGDGPTGKPVFAPISGDEHILGNPNAPVVVLEYSDTECPFCKNFHATMQRIADEYGKTGQVAWVYRHFPLDAIHSKARKEAEATECAAELGGNMKFWEYIGKIFAITPSNDGLDPILLPQLAEEIGLDRSAFENCLSSGKYADKVEAQYQDGISATVAGTPHSLVISGENVVPLQGAQPYSSVKSVIDAILSAAPE